MTEFSSHVYLLFGNSEGKGLQISQRPEAGSTKQSPYPPSRCPGNGRTTIPVVRDLWPPGAISMFSLSICLSPSFLEYLQIQTVCCLLKVPAVVWWKGSHMKKIFFSFSQAKHKSSDIENNIQNTSTFHRFFFCCCVSFYPSFHIPLYIPAKPDNQSFPKYTCILTL